MIYAETTPAQIVRLASGHLCRGGSLLETAQKFRSQFGRGDEFEEMVLFPSGLTRISVKDKVTVIANIRHESPKSLLDY